MRLLRAKLFGAVALALLPAPASADLLTVTITGTVSPYTWNGRAYTSTPLIDNGAFGTPGQNLFGASFTEFWRVDTGFCGLVICNDVHGTSPSPILSASLTINGTTADFGGGGFGVMQQSHNSRNSGILINNGFSDDFYINITVGAGLAMNSGVTSYGSVFPNNVNVPWTYTVNPLTDNLGVLPVTGSFSYGGLNGYLNPTTFTVTNLTELAAVPGPIAGAGVPGLMMILGGLIAWRRRLTSRI